MGKLELQQMVLGPVYTNCYFLKNKETGEALIVDPADSPKRIFQKVEDMGAKPVGILLTHGHFDHIMAVQAVKAGMWICTSTLRRTPRHCASARASSAV